MFLQAGLVKRQYAFRRSEQSESAAVYQVYQSNYKGADELPARMSANSSSILIDFCELHLPNARERTEH